MKRFMFSEDFLAEEAQRCINFYLPYFLGFSWYPALAAISGVLEKKHTSVARGTFTQFDKKRNHKHEQNGAVTERLREGYRTWPCWFLGLPGDPFCFVLENWWIVSAPDCQHQTASHAAVSTESNYQPGQMKQEHFHLHSFDFLPFLFSARELSVTVCLISGFIALADDALTGRTVLCCLPSCTACIKGPSATGSRQNSICG